MKRAAWLAVLTLGTAAAAQPVVLVETKVAQYRDASQAVRRHLTGAREVDPTDPSAPDAIKSASVVVAVGQKALVLATQHGSGVPVVFCMVLGISSKQVSTSVTGVPLEPDPISTLAHIRQAVPNARRIGFIYNKTTSELFSAEAQQAATAQGFSMTSRAVGGASDVKDAFSAMAGSVDLLWLPPDPRLFPREVFASLLASASEHKVPVVAFLSSLTEAGAIASVHADYDDNGDRAGKLAMDILSRPEGKRLPVPPPIFAPGVLTLNLKTAKALGIDISSKAQSNAKSITR